jgi:hypothetical protein
MSTTNSTSISVFETLGYQVTSHECGVYVLRNRKNPSEPAAVALLLTAYPAVAPAMQVKLFVQPVPAGVAAEAIAAHWAELDARRFEETGLTATPLELGPILQDDVVALAFERQRGGKRFAVKLPSGDVVCFN